MKKSLLGLTLLGAFSGLAYAQTSVAIYGVVDAGLAIDRGGPAGSVTKLGTGMLSSNRIGFKGSEDLGGGLSAVFQLENGFNLDNGTLGQGGLFFGRQAFTGLKGSFGQITFGRQYVPIAWAQYSADPFDAGSAGQSYNLMLIEDHRNNNTIRYQANYSGFNVDLAYAFGEVAGNTKASRQIGGAFGYENGPIDVKFAYNTKANATNTGDTNRSLLTAIYDFGVVKAFFNYDVNKSDISGVRTVDNNDVLVGATIPVTSLGTAMVSYIRRDDKMAANQDANQVAVGYTYKFTKRTTFYSTYGRISNKNGAAYTVGNSSDSGTGNKQFNIGMRHSF